MPSPVPLCVCPPRAQISGTGGGQLSSKNIGDFLSGVVLLGKGSVLTLCLFPSSQGEMPPLLRVQGDRGSGVYEAYGTRWDTLLLQGRLQPLCAWGLQGECYEAAWTKAQGCHLLGSSLDMFRTPCLGDGATHGGLGFPKSMNNLDSPHDRLSGSGAQTQGRQVLWNVGSGLRLSSPCLAGKPQCLQAVSGNEQVVKTTSRAPFTRL